MATMYEVIEQLCSDQGVKPGKMCSDLKISRGIISDLKAGRTKKLSAKNLALIANYLHVSTDYILQQCGYQLVDMFEGAGGASVSFEQLMRDAALSVLSHIDNNDVTLPPDVLDEVDVAFYGEYMQLSEDDKCTIRDMVRIMRERRAKKQE